MSTTRCLRWVFAVASAVAVGACGSPPTDAEASSTAAAILTAAKPVTLVWSPTEGGGYDFGTIDAGAVASQRFTLRNAGRSASAVLAVTLSGASAFAVTEDACSSRSIGPSKTCTVTVAYKPAGTGGTDGSTLTASAKKSADTWSLALTGSSVATPPGNTWRGRSSMSQARDHFASATIGDRIYAVAGNYNGFYALTSLEEYDVATDVWTAREPMPGTTGYKSLTAAALEDELYAMGGQDFDVFGGFSENVRYAPESDAWTARAGMLSRRVGMAATTVGGSIYVFGGSCASTTSDSGVPCTVDRYDPAPDSWSAVGSLPTPLRTLAAVTVDGAVYVIGGDASGTFVRYDPISNEWTTLPPMPTPRLHFAAATSGGRIFTIGGEVGDTVTGTVEMYDPATGAWTTGWAPMPTARSGLTAETVNGAIYAIGGKVADGHSSNIVEEYTPPAEAP